MSKSRARKFADMFRTSLADVLDGNSMSYDDLADKPSPFDPATLHSVATTGSFNDLSDQPTAGAGSVKAWVNWRNSGGNSLIASGNVSSATDMGTGTFRTNFSTNFSSATYTVSGASNPNGGTTTPAIGFNTGSGGSGYTTSYCGQAAEDVDSGHKDYVNNTVNYVSS